MSLGNLLIVEDDLLLQSALASALTATGFNIATLASDASTALQAVTEKSIDVALLDLDLGPGPTGIDIAVALRATVPRMGIVFLTSFTDPRLSRAGQVQLPVGSRYLVKQDASDVSKIATTVLQTKFQPLVSQSRPTARVPLTNPQIEVLKLVAQGYPNSDIANRLGVTDKSVERIISRLSKTLGLESTSGNKLRVNLVKSFSTLVGRALPEQ